MRLIYFQLMKKKLLRASLILLAATAGAQDIQWEKSYGGKHADYLFDAVPTADYGFLLAGSSLSKKTGNKTEENQGDLDYWIWKMDEKGELDWQKSFGGKGADLLYSIAHTKDGGFLLAGTSSSNAQPGMKKEDCRGQEDYWIIKLNAKGGEEWQRTIGSKGQDLLVKAVAAKDGGYLLGGSSSSGKSADKAEASRGGLDYWIVKLDSRGKTVWEKTLGGKYNDELRSLQATADGGSILCGYSNSPSGPDKKSAGGGSGDFWIVKLDQDGSVEWEETIGGSGSDDPFAILQTQDGNYVAGGSSTSSPAKNGSDFLLVKLSEKGERLWQQTFDFGKSDLLVSVVENDDRSLLLGGYARSEAAAGKKNPEGINDFIAVKVSEKGDEIWTKTYGSAGEDYLRKAIETRDGGYLLAGMSDSPKGSRDRYSQIGRTDFWVVKIKDKDKKDEKKLPIEALPNPATTYTNVIVGYDFTKGTASLYDLTGRLHQSLEATSRTIPVDMSGLPDGIYIMEVRTDAGDSSVKIMKN